MIFDPSNPGKLVELHRAALDAMARGQLSIDADVLVSSAAASVARRAFEQALEVAIAAIVLEPDNARAWALAGIALQHRGRRTEAAYAYETALVLGDDDASTTLALAELHERAGEPGRAFALVRRLEVELPPGELKDRARRMSRALAAKISAELGTPSRRGDPEVGP